mmetsp:Transcript_73662/g.208608  ORF Transcript_73662/g.208608 Transcript_73662/m.208608 type:complete len:243 (+) Transcript_73662:703-1431(+)
MGDATAVRVLQRPGDLLDDVRHDLLGQVPIVRLRQALVKISALAILHHEEHEPRLIVRLEQATYARVVQVLHDLDLLAEGLAHLAAQLDDPFDRDQPVLEHAVLSNVHLAEAARADGPVLYVVPRADLAVYALGHERLGVEAQPAGGRPARSTAREAAGDALGADAPRPAHQHRLRWPHRRARPRRIFHLHHVPVVGPNARPQAGSPVVCFGSACSPRGAALVLVVDASHVRDVNHDLRHHA